MSRQPLFPFLFLLMLLLNACTQTRPLASSLAMPLVPVSAVASIKPVIQPSFNYTIPLYGADATKGVIRFSQKSNGEIIVINIYAHDLPADHHYSLQYAMDTDLDRKCFATNWLNAGNGASAFDIEADRTGAIIEEYKMNAADFLKGASFNIQFQLRDHTSEVVLNSDCHPYRVE